MVVPLQDAPMLTTPPPAVIKALRGLRWCVTAMYACVFLRIAQGDGILAALSDLMPAVIGTYLLRDDPYFVHCYRRLQSVFTIGQGGQGGLSCLPSFMMLSGMNGALGLIRALVYSSSPAPSRSSYLLFMLYVSSTVYLATCALCCWAWKAMQRNRASLLDDGADMEHALMMNGQHAEDNQASLELQATLRRVMALAQRGPGQMGAESGSLMAGGTDRQGPNTSNETSEDAALRMAIEASMRTEAGVSGSAVEGEEDTALMAAIQQSQAAALAGRSADPEIDQVLRHIEADDNRQLVQEQNAEFEESLAMDQARITSEQAAQEQARLEEQQRQEEQERLRSEEAERQRLEAERAADALRALEEKRARLPAEPMAGEPGRKLLLFRLPSGQRCQRAFAATDLVRSLYDFVETEDAEMAEATYCLVVQAPRRRYHDRDQTLEAAGVENQSVLLAEVD